MVLLSVFSLSACAEIENGSKIHRIKITLSFYDADGNAEDADVYAKLYVNFAPKTIAHIEELINKGYYDGTCISNTGSSYAQFGDYTINADGTLKVKDQGAAIDGEFVKRGWDGNKLAVTAGSLVLKREDSAVDSGSKYDTGKATIAVCFTSGAFDKNSYCVFGMLCTDDADESDSDSSVSLSEKTSQQKMAAISELSADDAGTRVYYCVKDDGTTSDSSSAAETYNWQGQYITYAKYEDEYHYFKGLYTTEQIAALADAESKMLSEDETKDFEDKKSANASYFFTIPYLKVIIKKVSVVK